MIRKVMTLTINYDHKQRGVDQAFESVFERENVLDFHYQKLREQNHGNVSFVNTLFLERVRAFRPDWIWMQLQMTETITPEAIMEARKIVPKCVMSHWMGDCRAMIAPYLASICKATHLTLVSNTGQLQSYRDVGAPIAKYCQIGVDWEEDVIGLPEWAPPFRVPEVILLGHHYGASYPGTVQRERAIADLIGAGVDVGVVGNGWPTWARPVGSCHVKQQYHVWTRAKVGLCVNNFNDVELHYSDRQLIAMASGTPIVCYKVPGLESEFDDGVHCLMYRTSEELIRHVQALLANEWFRKQVGAAGRAKIMKDHTWWNRIFGVLPEVEKISASLA